MELYERVKLALLVNDQDIVDNYKKNSIYFYNLYTKSTEYFKQVSISNIVVGKFYFFHYNDDSNWMRWSPVFVCDYKKFSNKIIIMCVNFNFIPLEIRVMIFDKYITKKDFDNDSTLNVDYTGMYNELRKYGFEYSLMEYDASRLELVHQVSLDILPRFLYHQHPKNKYDPEKLISIWEAKLDTREERHKEMSVALIKDFFDINEEISEKYDVLKKHIQRIYNNIKKYG
jgi:hypothetical protein